MRFLKFAIENSFSPESEKDDKIYNLYCYDIKKSNYKKFKKDVDTVILMW